MTCWHCGSRSIIPDIDVPCCLQCARPQLSPAWMPRDDPRYAAGGPRWYAPKRAAVLR